MDNNSVIDEHFKLLNNQTIMGGVTSLTQAQGGRLVSTSSTGVVNVFEVDRAAMYEGGALKCEATFVGGQDCTQKSRNTRLHAAAVERLILLFSVYTIVYIIDIHSCHRSQIAMLMK